MGLATTAVVEGGDGGAAAVSVGAVVGWSATGASAHPPSSRAIANSRPARRVCGGGMCILERAPVLEWCWSLLQSTCSRKRFAADHSACVKAFQLVTCVSLVPSLPSISDRCSCSCRARPRACQYTDSLRCLAGSRTVLEHCSAFSEARTRNRTVRRGVLASRSVIFVIFEFVSSVEMI